VTTTVVGAGTADFAATVTALNDPSASAGFVAFSETVTNNGVTAANATFTQNVPANTTFYSLTVPAGWTCVTPAVGATGTITCNTTAAAAIGSVATFVPRYVVNVGTASGTVITDTATVTAAVTDSIATNNTASDTSTVSSSTEADLAITKSDSPDPVGQGQLLTYLIKVVNDGPNVATGASISDTLPANTSLYSMSASQGACAGTTTIFCALGSLAVNGTATVSVVVPVNVPLTCTTTETVAVPLTASEPSAQKIVVVPAREPWLADIE